MFLITDHLSIFSMGTSNFNVSTWIRTHYFDSRLFTFEKSSILQCRRLLPIAITNKNIIYLSVWNWRLRVFLHLVLLRFTPVASNSFSFPSLRSSYITVTLASTCFWIFPPSRIQSGKETDVGRQRLNHSSLSLSWFSELKKALDTNEYNWTTNSVWLILGSQYSLWELHKTSPSALRAETSFRYQSDPSENQTCDTDEGVPAWPVINQLWFP